MIRKTIIDCTEPKASFDLRDLLSTCMREISKSNRQIVFLCIGTDRSTGDCLGPLVGERLKFLHRDSVSILGNLQFPIHAKNLCDTINKIKESYNNPYIIAIDACLGSLNNVGKIIIENKPILPGAAMNKNLPAVGDISITGIVNISGALDFMVLQNTRLFTVMTIADVISQGIYHSIIKTIGGRKIKLNSK